VKGKTMPKRTLPSGLVVFDPPETREEIEEIERGLYGTPIAMMKGKPAPAAKPDPEKAPRPEKK